MTCQAEREADDGSCDGGFRFMQFIIYLKIHIIASVSATG